MLFKKFFLSICILILTCNNSIVSAKASDQPDHSTPAQISPQKATAMQVSAHWGDEPRTLAVDGASLFIAEGKDLVIIDITNPAQGNVIVRFPLGMNIQSIAASGAYVYLAGGSPADLYVYDVSQPDHPKQIGKSTAPENARKVLLSGQYLYVVDTNGLRIFNISDPATPVEKGFFTTPIFDLSVQGTLAYLACGGEGIKIVNVSNPSAPALLGSLVMPDSASGVAIQGNFAYLANGQTMRIVNVANPSSPVQAGVFSLPYPGEAGTRITASGTTVFVSNGYEMKVVDTTLAAQPKQIAEFRAGLIQSLLAAGNYLYIADLQYGLQMYDISDQHGPVLIGSVDTTNSLLGIAYQDGYAYAAADWDGLLVFDMSNPSTPLQVATLDTPNHAVDIAVSGDYAYIADDPEGIVVVDIHDPENPQIINSISTYGNDYALKLVGSYLYMANGLGGIGIFSLADPIHPSEVSRYKENNFSFEAQNFDVSGNFVIATSYMNGLRVIDFSDFSNPSLATSLPEASYSILVYGTSAYVSGQYGISIMDISDPKNPETKNKLIQMTGNLKIVNGMLLLSPSSTDGFGILYSLENPFAPREISQFQATFWNDFVYAQNKLIVAARGGLRVIDMNDFEAIHLEGTFDMPMHTSKVAASGNFLFAFDSIDWGPYAMPGLHVLDMSQPTDPNVHPVAWLPLSKGSVLDMQLVGNLIFLAMGDGGLQILDISDPNHPVSISRTPVTGYAMRVVVLNSKAYLLDEINYSPGEMKVLIFDVSDPTKPADLGSIQFIGSYPASWGLDVSGDSLYVTTNKPSNSPYYPFGGFLRINISDPSNPTIETQYEEYTITAQDAAVQGNTFYWLANGGIRVYNMDYPSDPFLVGGPPNKQANRMHLEDRFLYSFTSYDAGGGVSIFNVAAPEMPVEIASIPTNYEVTGIATVDGTLYLADSTIYVIQTNTDKETKVFLPAIQNQVSGIFGTVNEAGAPVAGIDLQLRFYNGTSWSTAATTTTKSNGTYQFLNVKGLSPGQYYYVRYLNSNDGTRLYLWQTQSIPRYIPGSSVNIGNFDIETVSLDRPYDGNTTSFPASFHWRVRKGGRYDRYEYNLQSSTSNGLPYYFTDPPLGRVSTYSLTALPSGFGYGAVYHWYVGIFSPDGGYGLSFQANRVTFTSSASGKTPVDHAGSPTELTPGSLSPRLYEPDLPRQ